MNEKKNELQMSEAFLTSIFLAVSGGFQDAYTYNTREEVFSNAQTGNVVLMSQNFMVGRWMDGLRYLFPLLAFAFGVFFAERIQGRFKHAKRLHWRQGILLLEIVILFAVGFIPQEYNMAATVLVSFACAMQVQTFRKVNGYSYASTMCIGNLRSGTAAFSMYLRDKRPEQLRQSLYYFGIILFFAIGAGIGGNLSMRYGIHMIWVCGLFLADFFVRWYTDGWTGRFFNHNLFFLLVSIPYLNIVYGLSTTISHSTWLILRLIPLARGIYGVSLIVSWMTRSRITNLFATYLTILFTTIYFCSIIFYYMEHGVNPPVKTYWDAFDWALMNVTTVGSNIFGVTKIGQILAVILAAAGMIFFPIFTAYVTTIFQRKRKETNGTADEQTAL